MSRENVPRVQNFQQAGGAGACVMTPRPDSRTPCVIHAQQICNDSSGRHSGQLKTPLLCPLSCPCRPHRATAAAIGIPLMVWAWNRHVRYWYYAYFPIAYPGDVVPNRLERRYG